MKIAGNPLHLRKIPVLPCVFVLTKGMTLIGPRPERPAFCEEFEKRIHGWHYRTMVTPGLSGLAQVSGGYDLL
ncbi:sugar transferase [Ellagibacter isourolithinifaciens]|uniref:sugar transferase n=1 Tax=Ellagibacter isourolithinifaciens TaxID=2137581 RepID=UPI003FD7F370